MSKYVIHSTPERMWYVENYLFPSMINQGIDAHNIMIKCDVNHDGCLENCMKIFKSMENNDGSWHLQDDVIICKDFKHLTEEYDFGIVCGIYFRFAFFCFVFNSQ